MHTFYHDLQNITSGSGISTSDETARSIRDSVIDEDSDIELDSLPVPNSSSSSLRPFVDDQPFLRKRITTSSVFKHSNIARISFSICFSESCTLFFLFMTQEIHILNTKYVKTKNTSNGTTGIPICININTDNIEAVT